MLFLLSCVLWVVVVIVIHVGLALDRFLIRQKQINDALADYVSADLQKTWEASAKVLVKTIRDE